MIVSRTVKVVVVDQRDVWSTGISAILGAAGCLVLAVWQELDLARFLALSTKPNLLLTARASLSPAVVRGLGEPRPRVVAVLHAEDRLRLDEVAQMRLDGVLASSASQQMVLDCLGCVMRGNGWIDPRFAAACAAPPPPSSDWSRLSQREIEVAHLAAKGLSNKRIARALNLSDGTVKIHMHHILSKLHADSRAALASAVIPRN